jgi:hypothetical protein
MVAQLQYGTAWGEKPIVFTHLARNLNAAWKFIIVEPGMLMVMSIVKLCICISVFIAIGVSIAVFVF